MNTKTEKELFPSRLRAVVAAMALLYLVLAVGVFLILLRPQTPAMATLVIIVATVSLFASFHFGSLATPAIPGAEALWMLLEEEEMEKATSPEWKKLYQKLVKRLLRKVAITGVVLFFLTMVLVFWLAPYAPALLRATLLFLLLPLLLGTSYLAAKWIRV